MTTASRLIDDPQNSGLGASPGVACWLEESGGTRHALRQVATVGRAEGNDIRIVSPAVSRYHAILRGVDNRWMVTDLDSRNGTRLNGQPIGAPAVLRAGDVVQFGDTSFVYRTRASTSEGQVRRSGTTIAGFATEHLRLMFQPGSFAQQQAKATGARLERVFVVISEIFQLEAQPEPTTIYLLEQVPDPEKPGEFLSSGGYAKPDRSAVYAVFRPESPGVTLERDLIESLGRTVRGFERWPGTLRDGFRLFITRRADPENAGEDVWAPLAAALEQDGLPRLTQLISQDEQADPQLATLAIANLLEYATVRYKPHTVAIFLDQISQTSLDAASRRAFSASLNKLEKSWRKTLRSSSFGSFGLFISLLLPYLRPYRLKIAEVMLYIVFSSAFSVGLAKMNQYLIDRALIPRDFGVFEVLMAILVVAFVLVSLTSLRQDYLTAWISEQVLRRLRLAMFSKVQSLHAGYFDRVDSGDLMTRMSTDLSMVESALTQGVVQSTRLVLMMGLALVVIFFTEWKLAFVVVVALPLFLLLGRYLGRPVAKLSLEYQTDVGAVSTAVHENLATLPVVKLFGLQDTVTEKFIQRLDKLFRTSVRLSFMSGLYGVTANSASSFIEIAVLGFGGYLVLHGRTSTGAIFAFIMLIGQVVSPMQSLTSLFQFVQRATGSMKRVQEVLIARPAIDDAPDARDLAPLARELRFEHVSFSYDGSRNILEDINLNIPAGSNVALVGTSGSGKSSVLNLITRFYDPSLGRILLDGVELRAATVKSLRGQMGMVFQDSVLFNDTIRENIRMGNPVASDAEVESAARAAELHEFITQLPDGYGTLVGERGGHLSGGQRQRIAIARAIIRNPAILLLDEATSALDPSTEASLNATLRRLSAGRTTISVTHRLASVVDMDQIFVFSAGRLVEQGRHQDLLARAGLYARLWSEQHGGEGFSAVQNLADVGNLSNIPIFSGLDQSTLLWLASNLTAERFDSGSQLMRQGEIGDRLYIIREGEVEVLVEDDQRQLRKLATLGTGDYVGEIALLREVPRTATVRARTRVEASSLSRETFREMMVASPEIQNVITETVIQRERELQEVAVAGAA